ncbi:hypothetical protein FNV43_RR09980 [Rhamnella rubrinervis]|uniref:Uncharacterized protein n=1 Tax=Rhamnella rubrinervis TaxID=2594499 RepID=A0A8K0HAY6_9ROSA|nr:hypothetical protein FNV43_RR09980 [Rhamnella rubrinervis]
MVRWITSSRQVRTNTMVTNDRSGRVELASTSELREMFKENMEHDAKAATSAVEGGVHPLSKLSNGAACDLEALPGRQPREWIIGRTRQHHVGDLVFKGKPTERQAFMTRNDWCEEKSSEVEVLRSARDDRAKQVWNPQLHIGNSRIISRVPYLKSARTPTAWVGRMSRPHFINALRFSYTRARRRDVCNILKLLVLA